MRMKDHLRREQRKVCRLILLAAQRAATASCQTEGCQLTGHAVITMKGDDEEGTGAGSPVSEAEDTAAMLCEEPLASCSSAALLLLRLVSTVDSFYPSLLQKSRTASKGFQLQCFSSALTLILLQSSASCPRSPLLF